MPYRGKPSWEIGLDVLPNQALTLKTPDRAFRPRQGPLSEIAIFRQLSRWTLSDEPSQSHLAVTPIL